MLELKKTATIIKKCSSKDVKPKSNFNYTVATQGDTGDIGFKDWKNYRPKSMMN